MNDLAEEYHELARTLNNVRKILYDIYNSEDAVYLNLELTDGYDQKVTANLITDCLTEEELKQFEVFLTKVEERLKRNVREINDHLTRIKNILGIEYDISDS